MNNNPYVSDAAKAQREKELLEAIDAGLECELIHRHVKPILTRFKDRLVDNLGKTFPDYQNIDNGYLFALHCELRVVNDLLAEVELMISRGNDAKKRLDEETQEPKKNPVDGYHRKYNL